MKNYVTAGTHAYIYNPEMMTKLPYCNRYRLQVTCKKIKTCHSTLKKKRKRKKITPEPLLTHEFLCSALLLPAHSTPNLLHLGSHFVWYT